MAAISNRSGSGIGVSGPAFATAQPRPTPSATVAATHSGPTPQELRAAYDAYHGRFEGQDEGPLSQRGDGVPDLNVRSNRIRAIVNTGVDFLMGSSLTLCVTDQQADEDARRPGKKLQSVQVSATAKAAQQLIDAALGDDDERMTRFAKLATNGGIYGHVFVKLVEPRRGRASLSNPPRLVLLNPETVSIFTDPVDVDLVTRYRIEYQAGVEDGSNVPIRKRQDITRVDPDGDDATVAPGYDSDTYWQVQDFTARGATGGQFIADGPARDWPYKLPPIIEWQNYPNPGEAWGQADVTAGLVALNRQLRLVESNINTIGYLQGHPILWSTGTDTGGIKPTPGRIIDLEATDAKLDKVDASGNLDQLMNFAEQLRSDMDEESGVPGVATGRMEQMPRGQLSGVTIRLLYAPLLARTEHKRRLYGQGIRQLCQTILLLCGFDLPTIERLDVTLGWQDPLPADDVALAQTLVALQQVGFSQHTLIERADGDPDVEAQWKAEEAQAQTHAAARGQGMPGAQAYQQMPMPGMSANAPQKSAPGEDEPQASASGRPQQPAPSINHPAAVAARNRMKAAFGKPPTPNGQK